MIKINTPTVSVIMPAYNAEKFIPEAVESVIGQSYRNWELIVLDDCSDDGTAAKISGYVERDPRIRYYRNEHNVGVAQTRNSGFALARGEWIAFLDSDDVWHPAKLEKQLSLAADSGADLIYCSYSLCNIQTEKKKDYIVPAATSYKQMLYENVIGCSTVLMKKNITDNYKFDPSFSHEDYALWLHLLRNGYTARGVKEVLVDYKVIKDSRSFNKLRSAKNRFSIYRKGQLLSARQSVYAFCRYAINGVRKHIWR